MGLFGFGKKKNKDDNTSSNVPPPPAPPKNNEVPGLDSTSNQKSDDDLHLPPLPGGDIPAMNDDSANDDSANFPSFELPSLDDDYKGSATTDDEQELPSFEEPKKKATVLQNNDAADNDEDVEQDAEDDDESYDDDDNSSGDNIFSPENESNNTVGNKQTQFNDVKEPVATQSVVRLDSKSGQYFFAISDFKTIGQHLLSAESAITDGVRLAHIEENIVDKQAQLFSKVQANVTDVQNHLSKIHDTIFEG